MDRPRSHDSAPAEPAEPEASPSPWWRNAAFALATALLLTGLALHGWVALTRSTPPAAEPGADSVALAHPEPPTATSSVATRSGAASAFLPGRTDLAPPRPPAPHPATPQLRTRETAATGPSVAERAAPVLTESGVMFFVGFCIGAALRAIARAVIVLLGLVLLAVLGLQYLGVLPPVDWHALGSVLQSVAVLLERGAVRLQDVLTHTLPSGTMAGLGLATGLRRR